MKKEFSILIFSILIVGQSYCQQKPVPQKADSPAIQEYRRISDSLLNLFDSIDNSLPRSDRKKLSVKDQFQVKQIGWTNDYEHIFSGEQIYVLDSIIGKFEKKASIEIAIVTIDSSFAQGDDFDDSITMIGRIWGLGKKDKNNGIVIGISTTLRKIRISNGLGIEAKLSDAETKKIIDGLMIPEFKQANFYEGTKKGLLAIISKLQ